MKFTHSHPVPTFGDLPMNAPLGRIHRVVDVGQDYVRSSITTERISSFTPYPGNGAAITDQMARALQDVSTGGVGAYLDNGVFKDGTGTPIEFGGGISSAIFAEFTTLTTERMDPESYETLPEAGAIVREITNHHQALWLFTGVGTVDQANGWLPIGEVQFVASNNFEAAENSTFTEVTQWRMPTDTEGEAWAFEGTLLVQKGGGGLKFRITGVAGDSKLCVMSGQGSAFVVRTSPEEPNLLTGAAVYDLADSGYPIIGPNGGSGDIFPVHFWGRLSEGGGGHFAFEYAQSSADVLGDFILAGSRLRYIKIGN